MSKLNIRKLDKEYILYGNGKMTGEQYAKNHNIPTHSKIIAPIIDADIEYFLMKGGYLSTATHTGSYKVGTDYTLTDEEKDNY